jgi:hypothetical protein
MTRGLLDMVNEITKLPEMHVGPQIENRRIASLSSVVYGHVYLFVCSYIHTSMKQGHDH